MPFGFQLAFLGCPGWFGFQAGFGFSRGFSDECYQAIQRVLSILGLGSESFCLYDQNALLGHPVSGQPDQAGSGVLGETGGMADVKAELHRSGDLVHVLSAGTGGPDEIEGDLTFVNGNGRGD